MWSFAFQCIFDAKPRMNIKAASINDFFYDCILPTQQSDELFLKLKLCQFMSWTLKRKQNVEEKQYLFISQCDLTSDTINCTIVQCFCRQSASVHWVFWAKCIFWCCCDERKEWERKECRFSLAKNIWNMSNEELCEFHHKNGIKCSIQYTKSKIV